MEINEQEALEESYENDKRREEMRQRIEEIRKNKKSREDAAKNYWENFSNTEVSHEPGPSSAGDNSKEPVTFSQAVPLGHSMPSYGDSIPTPIMGMKNIIKMGTRAIKNVFVGNPKTAGIPNTPTPKPVSKKRAKRSEVWSHFVETGTTATCKYCDYSVEQRNGKFELQQLKYHTQTRHPDAKLGVPSTQNQEAKPLNKLINKNLCQNPIVLDLSTKWNPKEAYVKIQRDHDYAANESGCKEVWRYSGDPRRHYSMTLEPIQPSGPIVYSGKQCFKHP